MLKLSKARLRLGFDRWEETVMRFESIIPFRRETESLRPDQRILSTSGYREVPARDECRRVARRNTRSAVETDRVVAGLNRIASSPAERINPLSSCRPCGAKCRPLLDSSASGIA